MFKSRSLWYIIITRRKINVKTLKFRTKAAWLPETDSSPRKVRHFSLYKAPFSFTTYNLQPKNHISSTTTARPAQNISHYIRQPFFLLLRYPQVR